MARRAALAVLAFALAIPAPALAQADDVIIEPPIPCRWWRCDDVDPDVVVESYRLEAVIENGVATTLVTQVLRNDSDRVAEGVFLFPLPADAAVTGLTLWIDGEPVSGDVLDGETARRTYEDIIRRTLDPALLEFVDDGLLRLSVFPMPADSTRIVEIEYRQALPSDGGLVRYRTPLAAEHNAEIEEISARVEIRDDDGVKAIHSPTHDVSIDRPDEKTAIIGFESDGSEPGEFVLYHSTDAGPISLDVITYHEDGEGYFLLLVSPGLATAQEVVAKDIVVVLDTSGSMEGEKFAQAQDAARFVLDNLNPADRFEVIAFNTATDSYAGSLRPASEAPLARTWVGGLSAGGSTNIDLALREAFALDSEERPLYVIFLTDGLPTEGVTDTPEILERLEARRSNTVSVFAFGVGYDVDTFLLDSIARGHHGTTTYVAPNEDIDGAVESLYSKVASPVMTGIEIEIDGVEATDVHPDPLPDVFSGGQLIAVGRYEEPGDATVVVRGMVRGTPTTRTFENVGFGGDGGDDSVPRLWATRKIGDLLRQVRLDGPDEETIGQIVRLSIRWGVVTPYTSYLVADDAPFGEEALVDITEDAVRAAQATTAPVSGAAAFEAADVAASMSGSDQAAQPADQYADLVRIAGGRTFRLNGGVWVDTTYDPEMESIRVPFGSDDYFTLAARSEAIADALTVGTNVVLVHDGIAYEVLAPDAEGDALPVTTLPGDVDGAIAAPATDRGGDGFPILPIAAMAALAAVAVLMRSVVKRG
ncbi:MAG TPA: VIT domain-containing protein [Acidimicrobiia bacterium]|nr:VIT domain-containing protein [Acidimicrobiia bacterium]